MKTHSLAILLSLLLFSCAEADRPAKHTDPPDPTPTTLEEAHHELEHKLPKTELAKIDAMKSEKEMIKYHFGPGMWMRNQWGLWGGGPLAKHMNKLGFTHPDDMSGTILETFWCKRHGKDFRLQERAAYYADYWKASEDPPSSTRDPRDRSRIDWRGSIDLGSSIPRRIIHAGKSQKTGRWLAYEHDKGVYVPDASLSQRFSESFVPR
ncbi:MAG: DUF6794 domain-containing protein [Verrucomicrobiaceae bacterium]